MIALYTYFMNNMCVCLYAVCFAFVVAAATSILRFGIYVRVCACMCVRIQFFFALFLSLLILLLPCLFIFQLSFFLAILSHELNVPMVWCGANITMTMSG